MRSKRMSLMDPAEAAVLDQITVRLVRPEEQARWDLLVSQHHYLENANLVGERLCYVVEYQGQWLALLGWAAAAYHLRARDTWIGWNDNQRRGRLHLVANNARFCVLGAAGQYPNLASRALALNLARLSADWQAAYGHPVVLVESFVDTQLFRGTAYKASGWRALGYTAGFKRVAEDFYELHERPKKLYGRELVIHAARQLRARELPEPLQAYDRKVPPGCQMPQDQLSSLWEVLRRHVPESRSVHGLRHKQAADDRLCLSGERRGGRSSGGGHLRPGLNAHPTGPGALLVQLAHSQIRGPQRKLHLPGAQSGAGAGLSTGGVGLAESAPGSPGRRGGGLGRQSP